MFLTKFIHLLAGILLFGGMVASYFYVQQTDDLSSQHKECVINRAIFIDYFVFLPTIVIQIITGTLLVIYKQFSFSTPWIIAAYTLLSIMLLLVVISAKNKMRNKLFHAVNWIMFVFFVLIIHDAVMKHTLFGNL